MNLNDTLTHFVPAQRINDARAAILAASDIVSRERHNDAVKREVDWANHWADKNAELDRELSVLRRRLDLAALKRANDVLALVRDNVTGGAGGKHDETCHQRHAACLARKVHEALTEAAS